MVIHKGVWGIGGALQADHGGGQTFLGERNTLLSLFKGFVKIRFGCKMSRTALENIHLDGAYLHPDILLD